jgi:FecR protein
MKIRPRCILLVAPVVLTSTGWLPNAVIAADFDQAQVTQVVKDVKVLPSGASARPAAVNETVHKGSAVQTGTQSRSELTFQDKSITRLGEKTIFSVGKGGRTIDLGSGQFLLYVPKNSGGAKVKMGSVTAAITGTTVLGNVNPDGIVEFTVLEGTANVRLDSVGQCMKIRAGQKVTYDPISGRLGNPVDVDIQQQLNSPLVADFGQLPSATLINQEIHLRGRANDDLARAVGASGATIGTATPEQFLAAFDSLVVRESAHDVCALVGRAALARPDLAARIAVAALTASRPVRAYSRDFKQVAGKELSCELAECVIETAIAGNPAAAGEIRDATLSAVPMLRDCIVAATSAPCSTQNQFIQPSTKSPVNPQDVVPPVSPEQPPTTSNGN